MNHHAHPLFLCTIAAAASLLSACGASPAASEPITESAEALHRDFCPAVPAALAPAADQTVTAHFTGIGAQIYICNATATSFGWTFVAPQANLLDEAGRLVGTHYIGPTWQSNDGSSVVAAKVAAATVDSTAIPWLLLAAVSHAEEGRFADVTSIQRLSTVGGIAPATSCDASHLGTISQVPYSAEYVFYKTKTRGRVTQCGGT